MEYDRCKRLEVQDDSLTSVKLTVTGVKEARPTLEAIRDSRHLEELVLCSQTDDDEVKQICQIALLLNESLTRLTLDLPECSNQGAYHLAELIRSNQILRSVSLKLNNVTAKGARELAHAIRLSRLQKFGIYATQLDLYDCCIGDQGAASFAEALPDCRFLQSLVIGQNGVTDFGVEALMMSLRSNSIITSLNLHSNLISHQGAAAISAFLADGDSSLQELLLDDNKKIGDEGVRAIAAAISSNITLKTLSLKSCGVGKLAAETLGSSLTTNMALRDLVLSGNTAIGSEGVEAISRGLRTNSALKKLDVSSCSVGDEGCAHLADALLENSTLTHLILHKNDIGDGGVLAISSTLNRNMTLQELVLTENQFREKGALALVQCLENNSSLTHLPIMTPTPFQHQHQLAFSSLEIILLKNKEIQDCMSTINFLHLEVQSLQQERDQLRARAKVQLTRHSPIPSAL